MFLCLLELHACRQLLGPNAFLLILKTSMCQMHALVNKLTMLSKDTVSCRASKKTPLIFNLLTVTPGFFSANSLQGSLYWVLKDERSQHQEVASY